MTKKAPLVLLVDDFADALDMYSDFLRYSGFRVAKAKSGRDGVARAVELRPDVILMDLGMPGMDGWEATRRLKADPATHDIPVIALTGYALTKYVERSREAGCDAFLAKPCLPVDLVAQVKRTLDERPPRRRVPTPTGRQDDTPTVRRPVSLKR
jgi:CheY-like chemotaxis protein